MPKLINILNILFILCFLVSCSSTPEIITDAKLQAKVTQNRPDYQIGPGDTLQIYVWRNPDISVTVPVRPDGYISTPLVQDIRAVNRTPAELAHALEKRLSKYIRDPVVSVIVTQFVGTYNNQIRVIGEAAKPQALPYRKNMTLLDVMIAVGGLTDFAAGNSAKIIRKVNGKMIEIPVHLTDLLQDGDISANMPVLPGDILLIPESSF